MDEELGITDRSSQNSKAHHGNDTNNGSTSSDKDHLHPHDNHSSGSPSSSNFSSKKESESSLDFGRGEKPSSPGTEMLKHATTGTSKQGSKTSQSVVKTDDKESNNIMEESGEVGQIKLPQRFVVKYLGYRETNNIWGIKYTRRPVDEMVTDAKKILTTNPEKALALVKMDVTDEGILVGPMPQNSNPDFPNGKFAIESISYGVQDLVYTRVFAMIVVKSDGTQSAVKLSQLANQSSSSTEPGGGSLPFRCHAFVCDSRTTARKLTYSLAAAFEIFSKKVSSGKVSVPKPKKFAIDLRSPEEMLGEVDDSEA